MTGERFLRFLKPTPARHLTKVELFTRYLAYKTKDAKQRASHITPNGYGSRLLMEIIKLADLDYLFARLSNKNEINNYLTMILKDLEKPVDPRNGRHTTRSLFVKSKTPCFEIISPSRLHSPLNEIPFDKPYTDPQWDTVRPFRVLDMGTCDVHFSAHSGYLHYRDRGPTHAVYTIDCYALIMKFLAYYQSQSQIDNLDQTILDFLHQDVIIPSLLDDTVSIWLRNLYKQQLLISSPLEFHLSTMWDVITSDTIGPDVNAAVQDILHLKRDLQNQAITAQTALASMLVTTSGQSFSEYTRDLFTSTQAPDLKPFIWVECLKYLAWWEMILLVTSYTPDNPSVIAFRRDVIRDVRLWTMMRPWQEIYNSYPFQSMVRSRLEGLYTYLKNHP